MNRRVFNKLFGTLGMGLSVPLLGRAAAQADEPGEALVFMPALTCRPFVVGRWVSTLGSTLLHGERADLGVAVLEGGFGLPECDHLPKEMAWNRTGYRLPVVSGRVIVARTVTPWSDRELCSHPRCTCWSRPPQLSLKLMARTEESYEVSGDGQYGFWTPEPCTRHGNVGHCKFVHATDTEDSCYACGTDCYLIEKRAGRCQ